MGIAFRDHHDDHFDPTATFEERDDNFNNLIRFRIDAEDTVFKEHLQTVGKSARYVSKQSKMN